MAAREAGQKVWFQIYLNRDRAASERLLEKVTNLGAAAVIFTVDVAWQSKRTRDRRLKADVAPPIASTDKGGKTGVSGSQGAGVSAAISGYQDPKLVWEDIKFIRVRVTPTADARNTLPFLSLSRACSVLRMLSGVQMLALMG